MASPVPLGGSGHLVPRARDLNVSRHRRMKLFPTFAGIVLLLVAVGGMVCWVTGFEMFREMLFDGVPVFFQHAGKQWHFPGRLIGALVLAVLIVCAVSGVWFLRSGFDRGDAHEG